MAVFRQSLHVRARPFAGLLIWLNPRFFRNDLMLIDEVALATTRNECLVALLGYRQDCHMTGGFLHNQCRIRVSGKRLLNVFDSTIHRDSAKSSKVDEPILPPDVE